MANIVIAIALMGLGVWVSHLIVKRGTEKAIKEVFDKWRKEHLD